MIYIAPVRWLCLAVALTAPFVPGCKCAKDGGGDTAPPASSAAPVAAVPAKPEIVLEELKTNAAKLRITLRIAPQINGRLDPKISLYEVQFAAAGKPKTDGRIGPSLKPIAESAKLSPEEVQALLGWLSKPDALKGVVLAGAPPTSERHASMILGWEGDVVKYVVPWPWSGETVARLETVASLVSADNKKLVDALAKPVPR